MKSFSVPGTDSRLRYHDLAGDGPAIVFVHGLGCASSCDYPAVAAAPALRGRRMLLVDLLGSGFSDRPQGFGYTIEQHAGSVAMLIEALGLPRVELFGHSMGGAVAVTAATKLGGRLHRLVLGEPNLVPGGGVFSRRVAAMSEADYIAKGHAALAYASRGEGNDIWAASLAGSAAHAVHRTARSLVTGSEPSWRSLLGGLAAPRTMIVGEASLPYVEAEGLPEIGVEVRIVPKAGHSMAWENPLGLAEAIAGTQDREIAGTRRGDGSAAIV